MFTLAFHGEGNITLLTLSTQEKPSVQKLVSAGLDLLKAGKKLKFNVDVKNPEALLGANKVIWVAFTKLVEC